MVKIVVADDHDIIREGIKRIIADNGEYTVVAEADSGDTALAAVREHKPDILLLDISMPERSGLDVIEQIHRASSRTKIIVVTMHRTPVYIDRAIRFGVQGYMHKENVVADLLIALKRVMNGEVYLCSQAMRHLMDRAATSEHGADTELTSRENDVLRLLVDGRTAREIAEILFISPRTVEKCKDELFKKLNVRNTPELVKYAIAHGLIDVG